MRARRAIRLRLLFALAEIASLGEPVREGDAALARGAWAEARAIFEQELEASERPSSIRRDA